MRAKGVPASLPGGMPAADFLASYWQRQPLLVRQAWPVFKPPLDADELAGLACEEDIESRLILERDGPTPWYVEHGPFPPERFADLPASHWTLLVQSVDHHLPEVAALLDAFAFLPRWRLDDIMISFATPGGSVGPHRDQYDVFLVQAQGRREWRLGAPTDGSSEYASDSGLCLLRDFDETERHVLEPGDMLYLPPGVPHHGVALDACMTLSVGFRAPAVDECFAMLADASTRTHAPLPRFGDAGRAPVTSPGEITAADIERLRVLLTNCCQDESLLAQTLGRLVTESHGAEYAEEDDTAPRFTSLQEGNAQLDRAPDARLAWYRHSCGDLFVLYTGDMFHIKGEAAERLAPLVQTLCDKTRYRSDELAALIPAADAPRAMAIALLDTLLRRGILQAVN